MADVVVGDQFAGGAERQRRLPGGLLEAAIGRPHRVHVPDRQGVVRDLRREWDVPNQSRREAQRACDQLLTSLCDELPCSADALLVGKRALPGLAFWKPERKAIERLGQRLKVALE